MVLAERLVHAAALQLVEHTPGDEHTQPAAEKAVAAVLREQLDWLEAWRERVKETVSDKKSAACQAIVISLLRLKLIETLDEIEAGGADSGS